MLICDRCKRDVTALRGHPLCPDCLRRALRLGPSRGDVLAVKADLDAMYEDLARAQGDLHGEFLRGFRAALNRLHDIAWGMED